MTTLIAAESGQTDRELLELAAKAAGIEVKRMVEIRGDGTREEFIACWNPLRSDGDAFRLAVKLAIELYEGDDDGPAAYAGYRVGVSLFYMIEPHKGDPYAATRRAVVRAAAAIGAAPASTQQEKNNVR